jgi:hypothetical protein
MGIMILVPFGIAAQTRLEKDTGKWSFFKWHLFQRAKAVTTNYGKDTYNKGKGQLLPALAPINIVQHKADSLKRRRIVFHGDASVIGSYSDYQYPGQSAPYNYTRYQFSPQVEAFGVPFKVNALIGSNQQVFKNFNTFTFSLDYQKLLSNMRERFERQVKDTILNVVERRTQKQYQEYEKINAEINQYKYKEDLKVNKDIISRSELQDSFSKAQNAPEVAKAQAFVNDYEQKLQKLKELELPHQQFSEEQVKQKFRDETAIESRLNGINKPTLGYGMFNYTNLMKLIYSVRNFDIGNCYPIYSDFTINGIGLKGVNLSANPGSLIMSFTDGKIITGSQYTPNSYTASYGKLVAGRLGYGNMDKGFLAVTGVKATDLNPPIGITDQNTTEAQKNAVIGLQGGLKIKDAIILSGEYAKSATSAISRPMDNSPAGIINNNVGAGAYAAMLSLKSNISRTGTVITMSWRKVGPNFSSFGTPYLRKDLDRYEAKIEQPFLKRKIKLGAFARQEEDNLLNTKMFKTVNKYYGISGTFHLRKLPVLQLSYSPTSQLARSPGIKDSVMMHSNMWSGSLTHTVTKRLYSSTTSLLFNQNQLQVTNNRFLNRTYTFNELISIRQKYNIIGLGSVTELTGPVLNQHIYMLESGFAKVFPHHIDVKIGDYYACQTGGTGKKGYYAELNFPIIKNTRAHLRADQFFISDSYSEYSPMKHFSCNFSITTHW